MRIVRLAQTLNLNNSRGQSLVQVLVTLGVMSILMVAMVTTLTMFSNENRALTEKLAANDLTRTISATISGSACSLLVNAPGNLVAGGNLTFNAAAVTPANPYVVNLNSIPSAA